MERLQSHYVKLGCFFPSCWMHTSAEPTRSRRRSSWKTMASRCWPTSCTSIRVTRGSWSAFWRCCLGAQWAWRKSEYRDLVLSSYELYDFPQSDLCFVIILILSHLLVWIWRKWKISHHFESAVLSQCWVLSRTPCMKTPWHITFCACCCNSSMPALSWQTFCSTTGCSTCSSIPSQRSTAWRPGMAGSTRLWLIKITFIGSGDFMLKHWAMN